MGNPAIPPQQAQQVQREPTAHNGILAWVPAQFIAGGSKGLPTAAAGQQAEHVVLVDVPSVGAVSITYRLADYRHRRSRFWHWQAVWAEAVPAGAPQNGR